ncbi:MAG: hypothetical protein M0R80_05940 [Proteobacteria bacterium]|jgi:hypothetical protein|nr:hypothetical protein [Pseudomonadota bacterium]
MKDGTWLGIAALGAVLTGALCSCVADDPDDGESLGQCDPLAEQEAPIELGVIIAAGRAADGTVYAVDEDPEDIGRVFVSEGDVLVRWNVLGSMENYEQEDVSYSFTAAHGSELITVGIEIVDGTTSMAVADGELEVPFEDLCAAGEVLTVIDDAEVQAMEIQNLPGMIKIEYYAEVEDGSRLLVTRPENDWDYEDFRLFLGVGTLTEREIVEVLRSSSGTEIRFLVDGAEWVADFPIVVVGGEDVKGDATLDTGSGELAMDWLEIDAEAASAFQFECFAP